MSEDTASDQPDPGHRSLREDTAESETEESSNGRAVDGTDPPEDRSGRDFPQDDTVAASETPENGKDPLEDQLEGDVASEGAVYRVCAEPPGDGTGRCKATDDDTGQPVVPSNVALTRQVSSMEPDPVQEGITPAGNKASHVDECLDWEHLVTEDDTSKRIANRSSPDVRCESTVEKDVFLNAELKSDDGGPYDRPSVAVLTSPDSPEHHAVPVPPSDPARPSSPDSPRLPPPARDSLQLSQLVTAASDNHRLSNISCTLPTSPGARPGPETDHRGSLSRRPRFLVRPALSKPQLKYAINGTSETACRPGERGQVDVLSISEMKQFLAGINYEPYRDVFSLFTMELDTWHDCR